ATISARVPHRIEQRAHPPPRLAKSVANGKHKTGDGKCSGLKDAPAGRKVITGHWPLLIATRFTAQVISAARRSVLAIWPRCSSGRSLRRLRVPSGDLFRKERTHALWIARARNKYVTYARRGYARPERTRSCRQLAAADWQRGIR